MPEEVMVMLEQAMADITAQMAPAPDQQIVARITRHVSIIGADWQPSARSEFIVMVASELQDFPESMVLDALDRARKRVTLGRMLLAWVCDDVEPKVAALAAERDVLLRLAEIAATPE